MRKLILMLLPVIGVSLGIISVIALPIKFPKYGAFFATPIAAFLAKFISKTNPGSKLSLLLLLPFLGGCSATMERSLSKSTPYAPVNEIDGGVVSYLNQGAQFVLDRRREDAYKKMHDRCGGAYKILQEGENLGEGMATPIGGSVIYGPTHYQQIKFECVHT